GRLPVHRHAAAGHAAQELVGDLVVDRDQVFLLQLVLGAQDLVDDVAIAGEQDQPFRILVQAPDREDPLLVADEVDDVALDRRFGGAGDPGRLVERDVDVLALAPGRLARGQLLAVDADVGAFVHFGTDAGALPVHGHPPLGDQAVGFAARAEAAVADVLVEAHVGAALG